MSTTFTSGPEGMRADRYWSAFNDCCYLRPIETTGRSARAAGKVQARYRVHDRGFIRKVPMTVLSDGTIRALMKSDGVVSNGDEAQAVHCSYEFLPGKIFPGGHRDDADFVIDWTDPVVRSSNARFTIEPSAVVWIRALQTVRMPRNVCGLWIKTNTLSRQGLMLINSSLVEPGYEGHLSCNFVNFGKSPVYITPDKPIAKLMFFKLDSEAVVPFEKRFPDYDKMIAETAAQGPSSFLQISDIAASLQSEKEKALTEIERETITRIGRLNEEKVRLVNEAASEVKDEKKKELEALKTDFGTYLKKAVGYAAAALFLAAAIAWVSDYVRGKFSNDGVRKADVESLVEKEVSKRVGTLDESIKNADIESLVEKEVAKRIDALRVLIPAPQFQPSVAPASTTPKTAPTSGQPSPPQPNP